MNIEGLGDAMVAQFWGRVLRFGGEEAVSEEGAPVELRKPLIHTLADLYH